MLYQIAMNGIIKTPLDHLAATDQIDAYRKMVEIKYIVCAIPIAHLNAVSKVVISGFKK